MQLTTDANEQDGTHRWTAVSCTCNLGDDSDQLLTETCHLLRAAYGENELLTAIQNLDSEVSCLFDLGPVMEAFKFGLPDPKVESSKPASLRNSRSEAAEMVARVALNSVYNIEFPVHPQGGKSNANVPFLGYDGWGFFQDASGTSLVLIQVKATDDQRSPPAEAGKLAKECVDIPKDKGKLSRAISIMALRLKATSFFPHLLLMLEHIGRDLVPRMHVAPVIVRGQFPGTLYDLKPVRDRVGELHPAAAVGLVITIGASLEDFGERVMTLARRAA